MSGPEAWGNTRARFYRVVPDGAGSVGVCLTQEPVAGVGVDDGRLVGAEVVVSTHAVLVEVAATGELRGRAVDPITLRNGALSFDPREGGVRTRENRRARGAFNRWIAEANHFGMVNAFVHTRRAVHYANRLLADLGTPTLPLVHVVVGAHFGSQLPGYGRGDGDYRSGHLRPFSGGHYRLSRRTTGVPEPHPVAPTGEIHLGPSRYRKPYAGHLAYLRNAAHNPAIAYHECGHHLCRHTADFRLNAERHPEAQRNGKVAVEEGMCDYFAAALLGTGRPYGWYRADRGRRRDPELDRHASELEEEADAHAAGAPWAAGLWRCRTRLVGRGLLASGVDHDRIVVAAMLALGQIGSGSKDQRSRRRREAQRGTRTAVLGAYLDAVRQAAGARVSHEAAAQLEAVGLLDDGMSVAARC